jgi:ribosomal protein L11 methyltransferase
VIFNVGSRFLVRREDDAADAPGAADRIPIILAHGAAFGSGEHETTASCLEEMEGLQGVAGTDVLDLGCGTGVLAIAAAKLGARRVVAVDPSPEAVEVTRTSVRLNGVESLVRIVNGEVGDVRGETFDFVLANIYADVLLAVVRELAPLVRPGGTLIMSGVNYDDAFDVKLAYTKAGLRLVKSRALGNYSTFVFELAGVRP